MRVGEPSNVMRWSVTVALGVATGVVYVVSLRANYLYGLSLAQTADKRELFAWANVAADIWKGFGLVAVLMLWRGQKRMAVLAFSAWCLCLITGVNSAIAVYVQDRVAVTDKREGKHATYSDVARELADTEARIAKRPAARAAAEVQAGLDSVLARPVVVNERVRGTVASISNACTKLDVRTATACSEVAALREERAAAEEAQRLEKRATELRTLQRQLRDDGSASAPDPIGEFWAWATRGLLSVRDVGFGFPLLFALLIETVSAFGPAVIVAIAAAPASRVQHAAAGSSTHVPATLIPQPAAIMQWLAENTEPSSASDGVAMRDLYRDFAAWCRTNGIAALDRQRFTQGLDCVCALPEMHGRIRNASDRYYGLRIVSAGRGSAADA